MTDRRFARPDQVSPWSRLISFVALPAQRMARRSLLRRWPWIASRRLHLDRAELGRVGEELAARELVRQGWRLQGQRVRTPHGEVDLWATRGEISLAVEVKTGRVPRRGAPDPTWDLRWRPGHSLGLRQRRRLFRAARYLARHARARPNVALSEILVARDRSAVRVLPLRHLSTAEADPYTRRHP